MDRAAHAAALLSDLAAHLELDMLAFDEEGVCTLAFDQTLFVDVEYAESSEHLVLSTRLGPAPAAHEAAVHRRLLLSNGLWRDRGAMFMAIEAETGAIVQVRPLVMQGLDFPTLRAALDGFVRTAAAWQEALAALEQASPQASEQTADAMLAHIAGQYVIRG
ncbi:MAG TPA: type III secretion system chaperone [Geminicoccaceae bacterium]|nr:type III secretion system chaperone [Geminicoccaceae bacterium]